MASPKRPPQKITMAEGNGAGFRRHTRKVEAVRNVTFEGVGTLAAEIFAPERILRLVQQ